LLIFYWISFYIKSDFYFVNIIFDPLLTSADFKVEYAIADPQIDSTASVFGDDWKKNER